MPSTKRSRVFVSYVSTTLRAHQCRFWQSLPAKQSTRRNVTDNKRRSCFRDVGAKAESGPNTLTRIRRLPELLAEVACHTIMQGDTRKLIGVDIQSAFRSRINPSEGLRSNYTRHLNHPGTERGIGA